MTQARDVGVLGGEKLAADVIVVGGGPAGSTTALLLARRGFDVLLLDRAKFPREKPCGEYLSPGVSQILDRIGVLKLVMQAGPAEIDGMRISTDRAHFTMRHSDPNGKALGIRRPVLDSLLLSEAKLAGVRVSEEAHVTGAVVDRGRVIGVNVGHTSAGSPTKPSACHVVVAADGRTSAIRRSLGIPVTERWPNRMGFVARYEGAQVGRLGKMLVGKHDYCGVAAVDSGQVTVGLAVPNNVKPQKQSTAMFFEQRLAALPELTTILAGSRRVSDIRGATPLARKAQRLAGPGYLLVGDAAGNLDPITGEGVFRALRGAELAADAIEVSLRAASKPVGSVPADYERACHTAFASKERVSLLIQLFLANGPLFNYVLKRLNRRQPTAQLLTDVLGDYRGASDVLRLNYLLNLLRP